MSCDISSPDIAEAYNAVRNTQHEKDWMILGYRDTRDRLSLYGAGSQGVLELQSKLVVDEIQYGLVKVDKRILLWTLLPEDVSGVRREQSLKNLVQYHHATFTISDPQDLSITAVRSKLKLNGPTPSPLDSPAVSQNAEFQAPYQSRYGSYDETHAQQQQLQSPKSDMPPTTPDKADSPTPDSLVSYHKMGDTLTPGSLPVSSNIVLGLHMPTGSRDPLNLSSRSQSFPAQPGSFDKPTTGQMEASSDVFKQRVEVPPLQARQRRISGNGGATQLLQSSSSSQHPGVALCVQSGETGQGSQPDCESVFQSSAQAASAEVISDSQTNLSPSASLSDDLVATLTGIMASSKSTLAELPASSSDAKLRTHSPVNGEIDNDHDKKATVRAFHSRSVLEQEPKELSRSESEALRLEDLKLQEETRRHHRALSELARQQAEQAEREARKLWEADQASRAKLEAAERVRLENEEKERREAAERLRKEEARRAEVLEREAYEKEKIRLRAEEVARLAKEVEESRMKLETERLRKLEVEAEVVRQKEEARKRNRDGVYTRFSALESESDSFLEGHVTVQNGDSIVWKRRYFHLHRSTLVLYKSEKDNQKPVDVIKLQGAVTEITTSPEEVSMLNSFKIAFHDKELGYYLFYTDGKDDEELLLLGINLSARLSF